MSIWKYSKYFETKIPSRYQLSLDEGDTQCANCSSLSDDLKLEKLYIKREDKNPTASFKDRSLAYQLSYYHMQGKKIFYIPSSGNAAISAIHYCKLFNSIIHVFLSLNISREKLKRVLNASGIKKSINTASRNKQAFSLKNDNVHIHFSKKAKSDAIKFAKSTDAVILRGSVDDNAIEGFKTIAYELSDQAPDCDSIFIPCSSGTSTLGIYRGYADIGKRSPQIHIIQTSKIHPIAKIFDNDFISTKHSLATAISDRVAHRKKQIINIVRSTKGSGWVISDKELENARKNLSEKCGITASYDSALSLAGLQKALKMTYKVQRPVLIVSGK